MVNGKIRVDCFCGKVHFKPKNTNFNCDTCETEWYIGDAIIGRVRSSRLFGRLKSLYNRNKMREAEELIDIMLQKTRDTNHEEVIKAVNAFHEFMKRTSR